jgi:hypothetical protein
MSNLEILRNKVKIHIRDIYTADEEVDSIILQVIEDIAREVKLFKKLNGFTVEKGKQLYDFRNISRMNEEVETELENVYIGGIPDVRLIEMFLKKEKFPDPLVIKKNFIEGDFMTYFGLMGIYDSDITSILDKFHNSGVSTYVVSDTEWLEEHDGENMVALTFGCPKIDEIPPEEIQVITSCVVEGAKYYFANTLQSTADAQVSNLFYQRYWNKKKELISMYPTQAFYITNRSKFDNWV